MTGRHAGSSTVYNIQPRRTFADGDNGMRSAQWWSEALRDKTPKPKPVVAPVTRIVRRALRTPVVKADLRGDNSDAQRARGRRTAGLGVAGGGYLVASRAKEVAPGLADWITRSPKKIGHTENAVRIARREKTITRIGNRGGAALVVGGLGLAAEGAVDDLRHRRAFKRGREQVHETVKEHVGKGWEMTLSDEIGKAGWGKAISSAVGGAVKPISAGISDAVKPIGSALKGFQGGGARLKTGMLGPAAAPLGQRLKPIGSAITGAVKPIGATLKPISNGRLTPVGMVGAGAIGTGAAIGVDNHFRKSWDTPVAVRSRQQVLAKAFDSEKSRHDRQVAYTGAATGSALVAGAGSVVAGRRAFESTKLGQRSARSSNASHDEVASRLGEMTAKPEPVKVARTRKPKAAAVVQPTPIGAKGAPAAAITAATPAAGSAAATPAAAKVPLTVEQKRAMRTVGNLNEVKGTHALARSHNTSALAYAARGRKLTRVSIGAGLGAAALGGVAYGIHDHDRRQVDHKTNYGY